MTFKPSDQVTRVLLGEQITDAEFQLMCRSAALRTDKESGTNRRFHQWAFLIEGENVLRMQGLEVLAVGPLTPYGFMSEDHAPCDGLGCRRCNWIGHVLRYMPRP